MQSEYMPTFKIRRKSDGLYSTGGLYPHFTKSGKVWGSKQALKKHFEQFTHERLVALYDDCEIEVYLYSQTINLTF